MNKYPQGIYLNIFFLNICSFHFILLCKKLFFFFATTKPFMFLLNAYLIKVLCPKSICFSNQLQGLKIIMNSSHVLESGLVSESESEF